MAGGTVEPDVEPMDATTRTIALIATDWKARVDNIGPFGSLADLRALRDEAPREARRTPEYHWLRGFIQGRELHEEFGGTDVTP